MIINHSYRFIFLHIPKTAGTSVTNWLTGFTGWNDIELGGTDYGERLQAIYCRRFKLEKHSPARQIRAVVGDALWSDYFKFAIVRHPLDRLVSAYHFYRQWQHPSVAPVAELPDFDAFLNSEYLARDRLNCTRATGLQSVFLDSVEAAPVDLICRFETLAEDIAQVAARIGVEPPTLPQLNSSERAAAQGYYTPASMALACDFYAADLERFGYQPY
jgi:hypothetical protein